MSDSDRPLVSVVIPTRQREPVTAAVDTIVAQTYQHIEVHVVVDQGQGQSWARNRGFERTAGEFVLFSDSDILWRLDAVERLLTVLRRAMRKDRPRTAPSSDGWKTGYAYGGFLLGGVRTCFDDWDFDLLKRRNLASTMSLVRRDAFPGFDEGMRRLEDWDVWLTLAFRGYRGIFAGGPLFETDIRRGVSFGNRVTHAEAEAALWKKHGIEFVKPGEVGRA